MGIPATVLTIVLMPRMGGKLLSIVGFALMAATFGAMALMFHAFPASGDASSAKFALFAAITFAISFGPNVVTYVLPAQLFPTAVRSRYHGASAAAGKVGATIGSFMYTPISSAFGLAAVMWVQVALCLLGVLVSVALLPATALAEGAEGDGGDDEAGDGHRVKLLEAA
jgi:PHS family inorganic phosphate transporter-like MFS transporter